MAPTMLLPDAAGPSMAMTDAGCLLVCSGVVLLTAILRESSDYSSGAAMRTPSVS